MRRLLVSILLLAVVVIAVPILGDALLDWGPDERLLPGKGERVEIGTARHLNVYEQGRGTPIVLVHGWASCAEDWAELPELLARLGHHVVVYDRPGYGYSTRLEAGHDDFTYASNARDLAALLDALQIERATIVGWSFGGGVAQQLAVERPERVSALALVASTGPGVDRDREPVGLVGTLLVSPFGSAILGWAAKVPPLSWQATHESVSAAFAGEDNVPTGWTIRTQAMLGLPGTVRTITAEAARSDPDGLSPDRIQARTLVFQGSDDWLVPYTVGEQLDRSIPESAFVGVVGGSHMLPVTHAKLLAEGIHELAGTEYTAGRLPDDPS